MPTTINHTAYPLLIDTVIDLAPIGSLLALRRTSKAFCTRIDKRLFKHATLVQPEGHAWMYVVFPSVPATAPCHLYDLPFACQAIEVLDVDRTNFPLVPIAYHSINPLETLVNLKTVRRIGWDRRPSRLRHAGNLDTIVDYVDLDEATEEIVFHLVPGQERHIAHIHCTTDELPTIEVSMGLVGPATARLREFAIVIWSPADEPPPDSDMGDEPFLWELVHELVPFLMSGGVLKIVGLETVHPRRLYPEPKVLVPGVQHVEEWAR
ncbi:uncharacterized protein LOC62_04G005310 [Vanrija pseudolonga]|uniref:F-box domain-containing protein n=1 Tax=Vanrija pseudolonga TaxID=143232 RepID=A0AAF0YDG6_9TREE|nr:hypothetical protein LOC62_04G005310 [Vanrija pseudolonga]